MLVSGTVVAKFKVYEDFLHYDSGIYRHQAGELLGFSYGKIIGWGVQKGIAKYWRVIYYFGDQWGENGLFKMDQGDDSCDFTENAIAGTLKKPHSLLPSTTPTPDGWANSYLL
jgi:cathepsin B